MKILLTRPEPGASATAARLAAMGVEVISAPCLKLRLQQVSLPEAPGAVILTSGQAIAALPARYRHVPLFCVGNATAGRAREAGFSSVVSAEGDARDLRHLIMARQIKGTHLLAVGQRHGMALAAQLRADGFKVVRRVVYASAPVRTLPAPVQAALLAGEVQAVLFYSADSARAFMRLNPPGTAHMAALALSANVAAALATLPWKEIRVALAPTEADLLALLT